MKRGQMMARVPIKVRLDNGRLYTYEVSVPYCGPGVFAVDVGDVVAIPPPFWAPGGRPQLVEIAEIGSDYRGARTLVPIVRRREVQS